MELEDLSNELWLKEYKREKAEKEGMEEYPPQLTTDMTHENEKRYVERVVIPNLIDMRRNYHN